MNSETLANETLVPAVTEDLPLGASALQVGQLLELPNGEFWAVKKLMRRGHAVIKRVNLKRGPAVDGRPAINKESTTPITRGLTIFPD